MTPRTIAHRWRVGALALAGLVLATCTPPQTALVIRIDSDLRRGSELASVHVTVTPDGAAPALDNVYDLTTTDLPLPGTVVLNAASSDDARALAVTVVGSVASGATIERDFTVRFEPDHIVVLDVYLASRCAQPGGFVCDPATMTTCGPCDCEPVDPGALPEYSRTMSPQPACFGGDSGASPAPLPADAGDGPDVAVGPDVVAPDVMPVCIVLPEVCNGLDDNCNGLIDDGLGYQMCGTGVCRVSTPLCVGGMMGPCTPAPAQTERCNGLDDDCDGTPDNHGACPGTQSCTQSARIASHPWLCCSVISAGFCPSARCGDCENIADDPAHWACCNTPPQ